MTVQPERPTVVSVAPERLAGWVERFERRHGRPGVTVTDDRLALACPDGAVAELALIWGPVAVDGDPLAAVFADLQRDRRFAGLLVHKGAHAVGVFEGSALLAARVGTHYVQGRTKAGGWSQQRYARRRQHQADRSLSAAADDAENVLLSATPPLSWLFVGGDSAAIAAVLARPSLAALSALPGRERGVFPIPEPRRRVLVDFGTSVRSVPITLNPAARLGGLASEGHDDAGSQ